ncbi:hypothetical protein [Solitalea lacus]|uniref:hypothetical protein n=1 Tax=Solitalea lacus TaxID=2911172 RepID=UPI001EDB11EF|nr:hypothetical protein [Solitalea lacus]UKJ07425.1 hypothetical protein L2B55_18115 [Solitalea lacus]
MSDNTKAAIEKYRKQFGPSSRKLNEFELPNSVKISRADLEKLLSETTGPDIFFSFSIGVLDDNREFLNIIASGEGINPDVSIMTEPPTQPGTCPCPQIPRCC